MVKLFSLKKAGLPPGTLIHIGERKTEKTRITLIEYDKTYFHETKMKSVDECFPLKEKGVSWLNVDGLHQVDIIDEIGASLGIHSLVLEDIVNTQQRPKIEDLEEYLFIVLKMFHLDQDESEVTIEQVSVIVGADYVVSFQERGGISSILSGRG